MTIDLQSFILGMGLVMLIALVVGIVVALVKVIKLRKDFDNYGFGFQQQIDNTHKAIDVKVNEINHQFENLYKDMDSRLDKQYSKIIKEVIPNKTFLQTISNYKPDNGAPVEYDQLKEAKRIMDKLDNK